MEQEFAHYGPTSDVEVVSMNDIVSHPVACWSMDTNLSTESLNLQLLVQ
jgi:hypothetical protein